MKKLILSIALIFGTQVQAEPAAKWNYGNQQNEIERSLIVDLNTKFKGCKIDYTITKPKNGAIFSSIDYVNLTYTMGNSPIKTLKVSYTNYSTQLTELFFMKKRYCHG